MSTLAALVRPSVLSSRAAQATGLECLAIGFFVATLEVTIWITGTLTQVSEPFPNCYAYLIEEGSRVFGRAFALFFSLGACLLVPLVLIDSCRPYLHRIKSAVLAHVPLLLPILVWSFAYMCDVTNEPSFQLLKGSAWLKWPLWHYLSSGYWLAAFAILWIALLIRSVKLTLEA